MRQLLGIETEMGFEKIEIGYQRIIDNLSLLDDNTLRGINDLIVSFGHEKVFKKKEVEALYVKTDSFVVESNVHFPTDYNLLWDSSRKASDTIRWFTNKYPSIKGWRKIVDWTISLKSLSRAVGKTSSSGGKNKETRVKQVTKKYLKKATSFKNRLEKTKADFPINRCTTNLHFELSNIVFIIGFSGFSRFFNPTCRTNPCNPLNPMTNILIKWKFVVHPTILWDKKN